MYMSLIVPLLVAVTGLQLLTTAAAQDESAAAGSGADELPQADPTAVPTADECTKDGFFCFEVSKGPKYGYKILKEDDPPLFTALGKRQSKGESFNTHSWQMSLDKAVDEAKLAIMFVPVDGTPPLIKIKLTKDLDEQPKLKLETRGSEEDKWKPVVKNSAEYYSDLVREDHSISFKTTEKFDEMTGLESRNQTIDFTLKVDIYNGDSSGEELSFMTGDVHVHFQDNPEIREWRERRYAEKRQAEADTMTIIIIAAVVALIVIAGIVFAVLKFRK